MTIQDINQKIQDIQTALSANPEGRAKELLKQGLQTFQSLLLAEQKKSESQPTGKPEQLPDLEQRREQENKAAFFEEKRQAAQLRSESRPQETNYAHVGTSEEQPTYTTTTTAGANIKTVKAPDFVAPDDLINVVLEDAKGNEYTRTGTKAQVRSLTRKYFSNVHESWMGKEKKMKTGFKNLLSYVVAWKEFDEALPTLRDVLLDYDRYKKAKDGEEASEAFKVAELLYSKIVEILNNAK